MSDDSTSEDIPQNRKRNCKSSTVTVSDDGDEIPTPKKKKKHEQIYRKEWEKDPQFSSWLAPWEGDGHFAICKACDAKILSRVASLKKHAESFKHQRNVPPPKGNNDSSLALEVFKKDISVNNAPEGSIEILKACANAIERVTSMPEKKEERDPEEREYDAVGVNVGSKLKRMHPTQAIFAEAIINKVLARGLLGSLRDTTDLVDVLNHNVNECSPERPVEKDPLSAKDNCVPTSPYKKNECFTPFYPFNQINS